MRRRLILPLFLPFLALLGGCPVWGKTSGETYVPPGYCVTHGDCTSGKYCDTSLMKCVSSATCASDVACTSFSGFVCDFRSTCVPKVPNACRNQADCAGATVCVEGFCRDANTEVCQFDYECGGGRKCVNSTCVAQCVNDGQCGSGQRCDLVTHFCVTRPEECATSNDCASGRHCVDGRCYQSCPGSGSCATSVDRCSDDDGFCRPEWNPRAFCTSDANCTSPSKCDLTDHVCRVPCTYSGTATTDDDGCKAYDVQLVACGADNYCHTQNELTPNCSLSTNCTSSQSCVDGVCR